MSFQQRMTERACWPCRCFPERQEWRVRWEQRGQVGIIGSRVGVFSVLWWFWSVGWCRQRRAARTTCCCAGRSRPSPTSPATACTSVEPPAAILRWPMSAERTPPRSMASSISSTRISNSARATTWRSPRTTPPAWRATTRTRSRSASARRPRRRPMRGRISAESLARSTPWARQRRQASTTSGSRPRDRPPRCPTEPVVTRR